ncbi:MAG: inositol monophosphatase [Planctomycetes bacterium]|nr:inositol monophosphatase [Planctomycetota bacterium]
MSAAVDDPAQLAPLLAAAQELAQAAGAIHLGLWRTFDAADVRLKSRRNPVTDADLAAERTIVDGLARRFPGHRIVAEEEGGRAGDAAITWHVDPLDGTVNFAHGLPLFCVSIAAWRGDLPLVAVVHAAALRETYHAVRGGGAWRNGVRLAASRRAELKEALLATGFCYQRNEVAENNVREFAELVLRCRDVRRLGSAALDLALVAAGHYDAYWEPWLNSWDIAAGTLLVREAGGRVTDLAGGDAMLRRGDVLASNGTALHDAVFAHVRRPDRA